MGVKGEINFVKEAGKRLLQGPVMVRSRLWDGEIEIGQFRIIACTFGSCPGWMFSM